MDENNSDYYKLLCFNLTSYITKVYPLRLTHIWTIIFQSVFLLVSFLNLFKYTLPVFNIFKYESHAIPKMYNNYIYYIIRL